MRHHDGVEADLQTAPEAEEAPEARAQTATPPTPGDLAWTAAIAALKGTVVALAADAFLNSNSPRYHGKGMRLRAIGYAGGLLVTPIVLKTSRRHFVEIPRYWKAFVSFGLFASLTTISQGTAYLMTLSSYVEAVKQVEILFAMAIGTVMFHEKQKVRDIAPGALVMLAGVVLLSLAG